MRKIDKVHQAKRDRKATGQHEQQHAIGDAVEQDGEQRGHGMPANLNLRPSFRGSAPALNPESFATNFEIPGSRSARPGLTTASSLLRLAGVLDGLKGLEFDVVEFAFDLLDLADVDVLHDVAGVLIN